MVSHDGKNRKTLSGKKKFLLLLLIVIFSVLALEGLFRGWLLVTGRPQSPGSIRAQILELRSVLTESIPTPDKDGDGFPRGNSGEIIVPHPYAGFSVLHELNVIFRNINLYKKKKTGNRYDILLLGGSVAGCVSNSIPNYFIETLKEDPKFQDKKIRIIPHAQGGYKQPQQVIMLAYLLSAGYKPDLVLNIDGFNEVAIGVENALMSVFPLYPSFGHMGRLIHSNLSDLEIVDTIHTMRDCQQQVQWLAETTLRYKFHYSGILGHLALARLRQIGRYYGTAYSKFVNRISAPTSEVQGAVRDGPSFELTEMGVMNSIIRSWVESSVSIKAMCDVRSIKYLHVLQPTLHDPGAKPITQEEQQKGTAKIAWISGARLGYPLLRKAGAELKARGVNFFDCSRIFEHVKETIYFDACHFQGKGNEIFGIAVAEGLLKVLDDH